MSGLCRWAFELSSSEEREKQQDHEDQSEQSRRRIAPAAAIWVQGKNAQQDQAYRNQQQDFHAHCR